MSDTSNKMKTPKSEEKRARTSPFGPLRLLAIVSIMMVLGFVLWVAFGVNRPNVEAAIQSLPGLPVMSGKPDVFTRNMTRVDQEVRKVIEAGPNAEQL